VVEQCFPSLKERFCWSI